MQRRICSIYALTLILFYGIISHINNINCTSKPMKFSTLASVFENIEKISARLEITNLLADLYKESTPREAQIITYLSLGSLRPPYESTQFGIAAKSMKHVLAGIFDTTASAISRKAHELGDLGMVAATGTWEPTEELTVIDVYERLCTLEEVSGTGSQDIKAELVKTLLLDLEPQSAQMVVRIILGKLRLGFSDMTIIDALSWMLVGDKSIRKEIENKYNLCADLGRIAFILRDKGQEGLDDVSVVVGIPIRLAAAERLPSAQDILDKIGPCVAQPKLDGFRLQIHDIRRNGDRDIWFFSRNLKNMSAMFPELVDAFATYDFDSIIVEGEALAYNPKTQTYLPFQETVKRKRKHGVEEIVSELPLRLFLFDILYLDGELLIDWTQKKRYQLLQKLFSSSHDQTVSVIDERPINTAPELEAYFEECMADGLEGLVLKRPDAHYQPGKRNFNWIKLKRIEGLLEDTLDCVVLGYYFGTGKRAAFGIGAFLVGVYDPKRDAFETVAKVGTGLSDVEWKELKKKCDEDAVPEQPHNVICAKELYPDVWVYPKIVVTVRADEITRSPLHSAGKTKDTEGFALRFPRFIHYRTDKSADEATTVTELKRLLEDQQKRCQAGLQRTKKEL